MLTVRHRMEAVHLLKSYYGEKYAFHYLFFCHFLAYLIPPAILSVVLLVVQILRLEYELGANLQNTLLDSELNGVFCLLMAIWCTIFVETWK